MKEANETMPPPSDFLMAYNIDMGRKGLDKVYGLLEVVFSIWFYSLLEILKHGVLYFDKKVMILKSWQVGQIVNKEDIVPLPVWMKLHGLDLKFGSLKKFSKSVTFMDENGLVIDKPVEFEWKTLRCAKCSMFVHMEVDYRKTAVKREWRRKSPPNVETNTDGVQVKVRKQQRTATYVKEQISTPTVLIAIGDEARPSNLITLMQCQDGGKTTSSDDNVPLVTLVSADHPLPTSLARTSSGALLVEVLPMTGHPSGHVVVPHRFHCPLRALPRFY
ncbi:hypothetical protein Cgig2_012590 [Carnegiea gigantea]|uniref:DUF4283 domain-containing protein n=1 Tax=Carnegiea gigantea TaxID=171969 RepID=A0A9Q1JZB5_9CARY|nr:hypothetical protein Cgig2_012590 [Carnegiea gigantea]